MATGMLIPNIKLLVTKGNDRGKVFETNRFPIIIGREDTSDFVLENDNNISRKHAIIDSDGSKIWIKDLNSTNGTFVNNIRINRRTELDDGTVFILGNTWIEFIEGKKRDKKFDLDNESNTFITTLKQKEAIFVLDLHDSSKMADLFGDEIVMKINKALKKVTIPAANKYKATFIKGTGDGFLITFECPENALRTAVDIMTKVNKFNESKKDDKDKIDIRIGLNYGECNIEPNGDRLGHSVNIAFRIEGLKYQDVKKDKISKKDFPEVNRVFISENLYDIVTDMNYEFKYIGSYNLKGIRGAHKIYQVIV